MARSAHQIIGESIHNATTLQTRLAWIPRVLPLVLSSYAYVGGYKHANDAESLTAVLTAEAHKDQIWKINTTGGSVSTVNVMKRTPHGLKSVLSATDGSAAGRAKFMRTGRESAEKREVYSEVSGKMIPVAKRMGYEPLPRDLVRKLIGVEPNEDGTHDRMIAGVPHRKLAVGSKPFIARHTKL